MEIKAWKINYIAYFYIDLKPYICHKLSVGVADVYSNDDAITWKHFPRYWPIVRETQLSPLNSPHKGQWYGALIFSLVCAWINGLVNNRSAGELRRHHDHYDVTAMIWDACLWGLSYQYWLRQWLGIRQHFTLIEIIIPIYDAKWRHYAFMNLFSVRYIYQEVLHSRCRAVVLIVK